MADLDLPGLFRSCESAWRLATLDGYDVPEEGESVTAFLRDGELRPRDDGWSGILHAGRERGAVFGRVQILNRPLTGYARYLMAVYAENAHAGEQIGLAYRQDHPDQLLDLVDDFWVFDGEVIAVMEYDDAGRFLHVRDGSSDRAHYLRVQQQAIRVAHPLGHTTVA